MAGRHFDGPELWDYPAYPVVPFLPISAWRKGEYFPLGGRGNCFTYFLAPPKLDHRRRAPRIRHVQGAPAYEPATTDRLTHESPVLAGIVGASIQGRVALGPRAGARVRRLGHQLATEETVTSRGPRQAHLEGFDLHANVLVSAYDRAGLAPRGRWRRRVVPYGRAVPERVRRPLASRQQSPRASDGWLLVRLHPPGLRARLSR